MQADESDLASLTWLQDLPHRIQYHRQKQQRQLHGTQQQESEAEVEEKAEDQAEGMQAQVLLFEFCTLVFIVLFTYNFLFCQSTVTALCRYPLFRMVTASSRVGTIHVVLVQAQQRQVQTGEQGCKDVMGSCCNCKLASCV